MKIYNSSSLDNRFFISFEDTDWLRDIIKRDRLNTTPAGRLVLSQVRLTDFPFQTKYVRIRFGIKVFLIIRSRLN